MRACKIAASEFISLHHFYLNKKNKIIIKKKGAELNALCTAEVFKLK